MEQAGSSLRDKLISQGIEQIASGGIANLSLRRVAAACGASCAAPYRHFRSREDFLSAIVHYINGQWGLLADKIILLYKADPGAQIIEVCMAFIRFLFANDNYRSVLSASGEHLGADKLPPLVYAYAAAKGMDAQAGAELLYTLRALVYGTVAMLENGELAGTPESYDMVRRTLSHTIL